MHDLRKAFSIEQPVMVFDRLKVKPGMRQAVIEQFEKVYMPMAEERGLRYQGHFCLPAISAEDAPSNLIYQWQYENVAQLWAARGVEENDKRLPAFWAQLEPMLESRSRQLGRSSHFDDLPPAGIKPELQVPESNGLYTRWLAFVKPANLDCEDSTLQWANNIAERLDFSNVAYASAGINHGAYTYRESEITCDLLLANQVSPTLLTEKFPPELTLDECVSLESCIAWGSSSADLSHGVKRTILFDLHSGVSPAKVKELEATLARWAGQIRQIANWSLSKVTASSGDIAYTHCFEQEFTDIEAITTDYLYHPYHWSVADRYFHAEAPEAVANQFFHSVRPITQSVIRPVFERIISQC